MRYVDAGYGVAVRVSELVTAHSSRTLDSEASGVVEEYLVEGGTPDLVGVGPGTVGLAEVPTPGFRIAAPEHGRAVLLREASTFDLFQDAEVFEDGHGCGKQGLADVFAGEAFAFEQDYVEAVSG